MAGSYLHLIKGGGWDMLENMGDARECVEELWWLVERAIGEDAALKLLKDEFYPMKLDVRPADAALTKVRDGMEEYDPDSWCDDEDDYYEDEAEDFDYGDDDE